MTAPADLAGGFIRTLLQMYQDAEILMLAKVSNRLAKGLDNPSWAEEKLLQTIAVRRELEEVLSELKDATPAQVQEALELAYSRGQRLALADGKELGLEMSWFATPPSAMMQLVDQTSFLLLATHGRILRQTEDAYRSVIQMAAAEVVQGTTTRVEAAQHALNGLLGRGITGFTDSAGRNWDLASYTEMATRSGAMNALVQGHVQELSDNGFDLVIVSEHTRECEICRPWEGKVLSVTGATSGYLTLDQARMEGLFHPNCKHRTGIYVKGVTPLPTDTEDPEGAAAQERQREIERKIREWKRREALALEEQAAAQAAAKVRDWQAAMRAHLEANPDLTRLYGREAIGDTRAR